MFHPAIVTCGKSTKLFLVQNPKMISWTFKTKIPFAPSWFNEKFGMRYTHLFTSNPKCRSVKKWTIPFRLHGNDEKRYMYLYIYISKNDIWYINYTPLFVFDKKKRVGFIPFREHIHIPPNGKLGKSSTQKSNGRVGGRC